MKKIKIFATIILLALAFGAGGASAQTQSDNKDFDKEGLKFSYPGEWTLTDNSTTEIQNVSLAKKGVNVSIAIISPREAISSQQRYMDLYQFVGKFYIDPLKGNFTDVKFNDEPSCLDLNTRKLAGDRLAGKTKAAKEAALSESFRFLLGDRLITLIYMRTVKDEEAGDAAWQKLTSTLSLAGSDRDVQKFSFNLIPYVAGDVTGRAVSLPVPAYPPLARSTGYSGQVVVRVYIDENGDVTNAVGQSGWPDLVKTSVAAARRAKFKPTMVCGEAIRVTGIIIYNFR
jgi:TonB family protein